MSPAHLIRVLLTNLLLVGLIAGCSLRIPQNGGTLAPPSGTANPYSPPYPVYPYPVSTQVYAPVTAFEASATPSFTHSPTAGPSLTPSYTPTPDPAACLPDGVQVDYGLVMWVIDGDSLVVDIQGTWFTVHYLGVDAPDVAFASQPYGPQAKAFNELLVSNQVVKLVKETPDRDQFGRLLRYVLVGDRFINYELIAAGLANPADSPVEFACRTAFQEAQRLAQTAQTGMWAASIASGPTQIALASAGASPKAGVTPSPSLTLGASATINLTTAAQLTLTNLPSSTFNPFQTPTHTSTPRPTGQTTLTPQTSRTTQTSQTAQTTGNPEGVPDVVILSIFYLGFETGEADEFASIRNIDTIDVNLDGWWLEADETGEVFLFPNFILSPGQTCAVYTNEIHPETCGFSFGYPQPLWDNNHACGRLYTPLGVVAFQYCY
jgi:endonuclease YncB( thermonuclease family)